jgi:hypothetical protein
MSYPEYSYPTPPSQNPEPLPPDKRKRNITIGIVAAIIAILLCCCVVVIAVLFIDPFKWRLLGRFSGRFDPVAQVAPTDSTLYMGVNLLNATPAKIDPIINAFNKAIEDYTGESVQGSTDLMDQINTSLEEFNMTVEDDIVPWVGQYAGMGIINLNLDAYGSLGTVDFFVAIEARDSGKADSFLLKLSDEIAQSWDGSVDTSEYAGSTIYYITESYQELAFARAGGLVILANSDSTIEDVIDAQKGDSLADDAAFKNIINQLPAERMVTFYMPASALADLSDLATSQMGVTGSTVQDLYASMSGMAFSLSVVNAGVQFDSVVSYDPAQFTDTQRQMLEAAGRSNNTANMLPDNTFAYITGQRLDLGWESIYETLSASTGGDYEEAINQLEDIIGFNPTTDLFPYLSGSYVLGVFPSSNGVFAEQANVEIGFLLASQTNDEEALLSTVDNFNHAFEDAGLGEINDASSGNMTIFDMVDSYSGNSMFAYGVGQGWLGLASSVAIMEGIPNQSNSLSQNPTFRSAQAQLPGGVNTVAYINLTGTLDAISNGMDSYDRDSFDEGTFFLRPIEYLIIGGSSLSGDTMRSTTIVAIPTP